MAKKRVFKAAKDRGAEIQKSTELLLSTSSKVAEEEKKRTFRDIILGVPKDNSKHLKDELKLLYAEKAKQFFQLNSFEEKLAFWKEENLGYMEGAINVFEEGQFSLYLLPKTKKEFEAFNLFALQQMEQRFNYEANEGVIILGIQVTTFDSLKRQFFEVHKKSPLREEFVLNEIKRIKKIGSSRLFKLHFAEEYKRQVSLQEWDLSFRWDFDDLERLILIQPYVQYLIFLKSKKFLEVEVSTNFNKPEFILPKDEDIFLEIENRLIKEGFIEDGVWVKEKILLIGCSIIIWASSFCKRNYQNKKLTFSKFLKLMGNRYKIDLKEMGKPNKIKKSMGDDLKLLKKYSPFWLYNSLPNSPNFPQL
jgi:hypothetical protein